MKEIVDSGLKRACLLLDEHKDELELLAKTLLERETLDDDEVRKLLKFEPRKREF